MQAKRLENVHFSPIRQILAQASELELAGKNILHLEIGEPDFPTPSAIIDKTKEALDQGFTHYGSNRGDLQLRKILAEKLKVENAVQYNPETEIIMTVGAAEAISDAISAFLNPGDEAIIFEPAFFNYEYCMRINGVMPVIVSLRAEDGFQINEEILRKVITSKTKMIIINTPHNPTGTVLTKKSIELIAEIAQQFNLLVLSDEIYEKIIFDDSIHYSIASFPGMKERTITINGFSKAYAMTGWRLAYICAPETLMPAILKMHQYTTTCATNFVQKGLVAGMGEAADDVVKMVSEFDRRRKYLINAIDSMEGLSYIKPQGAFYMFVNVSKTGMSSTEFAETVLNKAGVALVPGSVFGKAGEDFVRISYATAYPNLVEAMERIRKIL